MIMKLGPGSVIFTYTIAYCCAANKKSWKNVQVVKR